MAYNHIYDFEKQNKAYESYGHYLKDILKLVDTMVYTYYEINNKSIIDDGQENFKGIFIQQEEFEAYNNEKESSKKNREERNKLLHVCRNYIKERAYENVKNGMFFPLIYIQEMFNLNEFEEVCLILGLAHYIGKKYEKIFGYLQDDITKKIPTLDCAIKLYTGKLDNTIEHSELIYIANKKIFKYFSVENRNESTDFLGMLLLLDKDLVKFLLKPKWNMDENSNKLFFNEEKIPPVMCHRETLEHAIKFIDNTDETVVFIHGESGKRHLVKQIAVQRQQSIIWMDIDELYDENHMEFMKRIDRMCRTIIIQQSVLCIIGLGKIEKKYSRHSLKLIINEIMKVSDLLFMVSQELELLELEDDSIDTIYLELLLPNINERREIWNYYSKSYELDESINLSSVANKFLFSQKQIKNSLKLAKEESLARNTNHINEKTLHKACYNQVLTKLDDVATLIEPVYKWDDLILPKEQKDLLFRACNQVIYKHIVFEQWGFSNKLAYGKGLSILLAGPPGTGKTMSAQVIANELNMEIYKIDLSQVVSKYIGETEKTLKRIFDEAKKSNIILFFDETDAILGKRSDVKDAHDKYANVETSFLLQKMEEFEGILIMTTNFIENIDNAFIRRITYVVHVAFPESIQRKIIWKKIFPVKMPLSEDIDFEYLANQFKLSGGSIKNIAITSAFLAASKGEVVSMKHILPCIRDELKKYDKVLLKEDFGEYFYYL